MCHTKRRPLATASTALPQCPCCLRRCCRHQVKEWLTLALTLGVVFVVFMARAYCCPLFVVNQGVGHACRRAELEIAVPPHEIRNRPPAIVIWSEHRRWRNQ